MARETKAQLSLREEATRWWVVFHEDGATLPQCSEFAEWLTRSPERIEAYLRTVRLMRALESSRTPWPDTPAESLIQAAKDSAIAMPRQAGSPPSRPPRFRVRRWAGFAAAAALVGCVIAGLYMMLAPDRYTTTLGERRSILLADGSRVSLDSASSIAVEFTRQRRVVRLLHGEALFNVAHDAGRPFDVYSRASVIRAIGTEFNVDMSTTKTTVTVLAGRVAVMEAAGADRLQPAGGQAGAVALAPAPDGAVILGASERVVITAAGAGKPEAVRDPAAATAWLQRRFQFDHLPLGEVAEELSRYTTVPIVIDSAELRGREISGVIELDDPASFLSFLSSVPDVEIRRTADGSQVVEFRPTPSAP